MFLPFFGGLLLDSIGMKFGIILFIVISTIGQLVFYIGSVKEVFWLSLMGRVIFGLGGES
jgi:hypothetical protein